MRLKHTSTKRLKEKLFNRLDQLRLSKNTSFDKEREFIDENQGKPFDCLLIYNGGPGLCHICDVTIECLWLNFAHWKIDERPNVAISSHLVESMLYH